MFLLKMHQHFHFNNKTTKTNVSIITLRKLIFDKSKARTEHLSLNTHSVKFRS